MDRNVQLRSFEKIHVDELRLKLDTHISSSQAFAINRQISRCGKKFASDNPELGRTAISSFLAFNQLAARVQLKLTPEDINNAALFIRVALERYTSSVNGAIQDCMSLDHLLSLWRFGPGASNGVRGSHFCEKVTQVMTTTSEAQPFTRLLRCKNPYFRSFDAVSVSGTALVKGNRIETVPKNQDTARTIAIEPLGNMALQLAAGRYLEETLALVGLDITKQQPLNQELALLGSIHGGFATIDLKSASDLISIELCRVLLPPEWFYLLCKLRSHYCELPGGQVRKLHMMSTMGNGFTFPLMTLIMASLIYATNCRLGKGRNLHIDWSRHCVFGDDIIVPTDTYDEMCEVLTCAGLIVNYDKSYAEGPFRESCGGDYFEGSNVTPFYVESLFCDADVYVAINQLLQWSRRVGVWLPSTFLYLKSLLKRGPYLVPEWSQPTSGIQTTQVSRRYTYLLPIISQREMEHHDLFTIMAAVGGYLYTSGGEHLYSPRPRRVKYRRGRARLPKGYLDGWDPLKGGLRAAQEVAFFVNALI